MNWICFSFSWKFFYLVIGFSLYFNVHVFSQSYSEVGLLNGINGTCGDCEYGGGVSFVDFDGDGLDDLTFGTELGQNLIFYKNTGSGFELLEAPVDNFDENKQILWFDLENDGDKDLFVVNYQAPNRLYLNNGNFNFSDITESAGIILEDTPSFSAAIGDVDNDGLLDIFVSSYSLNNFQNRLYRNNGDNSFSEISGSAGLPDNYVLPNATAFFDFNNNGLQDLFIGNDNLAFLNQMLKNLGDGTFEDVSSSSNLDVAMDAMNAGIADYDNDGDLDIYVTNKVSENQLFRNNGDETFTEIASQVGVDNQINQLTWGGNFFDCDNDLDLDLYVSSSLKTADFPSKLFINDLGSGNFSTILLENDTLSSFANAIGDFNLDGLMDIVVNNAIVNNIPDNEDVFQLWQNTTSNANNWLKVFLVGTESNRDGIGSWIEMYINGQKYVRYKHCGIAYMAQNSNLEHFGMGPFTEADSVIVRWLSGNADIFYDVTANQILTIVEGSSPIINCDEANISAPVSMDVSICDGDEIPALEATAEAGYEVYWYGNPTGGPLLVSNSTTYTPTGAG
ncbi:MAG: CRTAC1 family protein, partial [Bacteroidetes bacterium]